MRADDDISNSDAKYLRKLLSDHEADYITNLCVTPAKSVTLMAKSMTLVNE